MKPLFWHLLFALALAAQPRPLPPGPGDQPFVGGPFNTPLPPNPQYDPDSDKIIAGMTGQLRRSVIAPLRVAAPPVNGVVNRDYNTPVYYSLPSDPEYRIVCRATFAKCPLQGKLIHIPDFARPEPSGPFTVPDSSDHHLAIIDQANGVEHDFWQATLPGGRGGDFPIGFGSSGPLDSQGTAFFAATQAQFALTAGNIRAVDLAAGVIPHAIAFVLPCANNYQNSKKGVYPATTGSDQLCKKAGPKPYFGMRLQLAMTDAQIAALNAPPYVKTIYTALAHYGAFLSDTGNGEEGRGELALRAQSGLTYTQIGLPDPWEALARQNNLAPQGEPPARGFTFLLDVPGVDVGQYWKVVAPCVTSGTC